jgi:hypothetical protein
MPDQLAREVLMSDRELAPLPRLAYRHEEGHEGVADEVLEVEGIGEPVEDDLRTCLVEVVDAQVQLGQRLADFVLGHADLVGTCLALTESLGTQDGAAGLGRGDPTLAEGEDGEDPAFIANAVDEMQRYITLDQSGRARVALEDVEIDGHLIRAGEGVIISLETMNRDSRVFERPSELDFTRPNSDDHAAYGQGIHRCLGERLAQVELQIGLKSLFARAPGLRTLAPLDELEFKTDHTVYGMRGLPVAWD